MNTHADKTQENKSQSAANEVSQKQSGGESSFQFEDNRPDAVAQRKLQEMANNSQKVSQQKVFQNMANNSPQAKQATRLQAMADNHSTQQQQPIQKKENNTGLPDDLKAGIENLSGYSMDEVNVHYNSDKPAQMQAHAYAQGTDIHIASGQDKHLPHEAWHVVQQKQERAKPTMWMGNVSVNDDVALEREADLKGAQALQAKFITDDKQKRGSSLNGEPVVQRVPTKVRITWGITHVVRKMQNSLFGGKDYKEGEINARGELHTGQIITIDDEKTFTSRRGPNQEDAEIRAANEKSKPSFVWYHVLSLGGEDVSAEKLYVRQGTFGQAPLVVMDGLSPADEKVIHQIVSTAMHAGADVQGEWFSFIDQAIGLSARDAGISLRMIQKMYALHVLGALLKRNYPQLQLALELDLAPAQGMKLILPLVAKLIRQATGLTVNGLEAGGNYEGWTSLSTMSDYLQTAFKTFTSLFITFGTPGRLSLLKTLRSSDSNIEKFINLMVSAQVRSMLAASGPQGRLEGELAGHSTASGGIGRGLVNVAADYLANEFLLTRYTQTQIYELDYEESAASFQYWLTSEGYTFEVIRDAIRNSARGSDEEAPISTAEVKKLLLNYQQFSL